MSIQPSDDREKASDETDPTQSPPEAFGGSEGHHLTVGMTGSGKSYSVARRARSWLSESADRTLVIVAKNSSYNGFVGECDGIHYDGMGLERAVSDEQFIKPNSATLAIPDSSPADHRWGEVLDRFIARFSSFADEKPGEAALILDDVPIGGVTESDRLSSYEQLLTDGDSGQLWRVTQLPAAEPVSLSMQEYLHQFTAIDLFGSPRPETLGEEFELFDPHRRYLSEDAGVVRKGGDGYSFGLGRSHARQPWYRFRETTTDQEHAVLDYRGWPSEFELGDEL